MARPRKLNDEKRNKYITIHVTEQEFYLLTQKAKRQNMSRSRYIRETGLSSDDTRLPKVRFEAIREIRRIGVNINQLQHHINEVMKLGGNLDYSNILQQIYNYFELLHTAISSLKVENNKL